MAIEVLDTTHYVYLKTGEFDEEYGLDVNTIPLKATSIGVSVTRTVPNLPVPLSSLVRGEAERVGVDLGLGDKSIEISGIITNQSIKRSHTGTQPNFTRIEMTAAEIAQLIASGVDSSGLARHQTMNELVFKIESNIDHEYNERSAPLDIPFTFASRGDPLEKDNKGVPLPSDFPQGSTQEDLDKQTGIKGYIESFSFNIEADSPVEISFSMSFKVARIFP
jgi:hypothetical protein